MVGVLCIGVLEVDCIGVAVILVLGGIFVVEVVEGVELVVGCVVRRVVRLVLWCLNVRGYFLHYCSLKLVEMNEMRVNRFFFGMAIWADCFIFLERGNQNGKPSSQPHLTLPTPLPLSQQSKTFIQPLY